MKIFSEQTFFIFRVYCILILRTSKILSHDIKRMIKIKCGKRKQLEGICKMNDMNVIMHASISTQKYFECYSSNIL